MTGAGLALPLFTAGGAHAADATTWDRVAQCESGGVWSAATGNGFYGGLQLTQEMWDDYGGSAYASRPDLASRAQQIAVAQAIVDDRGPDAFPSCALHAGLTKGGPAPSVDPGATSRPSPRPTHGGPDGRHSGTTGGADGAGPGTPTPAPSDDGSGSHTPGSPSATPDPSDPSGSSSATPSPSDSASGSPSGSPSPSGSGAPSDSASPSDPASGTPSASPSDDDPSGSPAPSDPSGSSAPSDPTDPAQQPTHPAHPTGPTDPADPASPAPSDSTGPTDPDAPSTPPATGKHRGAPGDGADSGDGRDGGSGRHASRGGKDSRTPPADDGRYRVRPGDNLSAIAESHDLPGGWPALYDRNQGVIGSDADLIHPGQLLDLGRKQG
ncbi:transglycosylase family protein [Streptomyces sp. MspMP-M5]|uniref:transglycosylase family protein n=1 Tax=unclassified Streptomyces TaxID=2593676 RepID=UPI0003719ED2|nr:transglycosylase family protein [Streptomyces sp. MspMP-M5]